MKSWRAHLSIYRSLTSGSAFRDLRKSSAIPEERLGQRDPAGYVPGSSPRYSAVPAVCPCQILSGNNDNKILDNNTCRWYDDVEDDDIDDDGENDEVEVVESEDEYDDHEDDDDDDDDDG